MVCETTSEGLKLCIENSYRLLEDACTEGLSLPTVGALLELGLEESAKSLLIFTCLLKTQIKESTKYESPRSFNLDIKENFEKIKENFEKFFDEIDCASELKSAFTKHEVKIKIIRNLGSLLKGVMPYYNFSNNSTTIEFLKNRKPEIDEDELKKHLDQPGARSGAENFLYGLFESMTSLSGAIKENGIYVNCNDSVFVFPKIEKEIIMKMAVSLYSIIYALTKFLTSFGEVSSLSSEIVRVYPKIIDLQNRIDKIV